MRGSPCKGVVLSTKQGNGSSNLQASWPAMSHRQSVCSSLVLGSEATSQQQREQCCKPNSSTDPACPLQGITIRPRGVTHSSLCEIQARPLCRKTMLLLMLETSLPTTVMSLPQFLLQRVAVRSISVGRLLPVACIHSDKKPRAR